MAIKSRYTLVSIPFRADTGFELSCRDICLPREKKFQSLSGLTLGLNGTGDVSNGGCQFRVSIPFRADTGFEPKIRPTRKRWVGRWFQSLSGLTLGLNFHSVNPRRLRWVFQSLSGLTLGLNAKDFFCTQPFGYEFQSLSGLTLGLNLSGAEWHWADAPSFNPFQG